MLNVIVPTCGAISEEYGFFFERFLDSFCSFPPNGDWQAVIVANNDDVERLHGVSHVVNKWQAEGVDFVLVTVPRKIGYVGACNLGYRVANAVDPIAYVAVLNDDTIIDGDWFTPLKDAIDSGAGQVGPSIHHVGRDGKWGRGDEKYEFIEGWCFVTQVVVIDEVIKHHEQGTGMFDEIYAPAYCEDVDFSIAIQDNCLDIWGVDNVPIRHLHSQTISNREPYWTNNRKKLIEKWSLADDKQVET